MNCTEVVVGTSAASALASFHRMMQQTKQLSDDRRTVARPQLAHDQYTINTLAVVYNPSGSSRIGEMVESEFDIPPNPTNPDLSEKPKKEVDNMMGFMDGLTQGKLAE